MTDFPHLRFGVSIIGASSFHFSVRDGKRWFQTAQITKVGQL